MGTCSSLSLQVCYCESVILVQVPQGSMSSVHCKTTRSLHVTTTDNLSRHSKQYWPFKTSTPMVGPARLPSSPCVAQAALRLSVLLHSRMCV